MPLPRTEPKQPTPAFVRACDNMRENNDRTWQGNCPICSGPMRVAPVANEWAFRCDGPGYSTPNTPCRHDEIVRWLGLSDLRVDRDHADRAWVALVLANTTETWQALLEGRPVARQAVNQLALKRLQRLGVL